MKLSIIIPVFKVEAYVASCLDSIYSQGLPADDFEVIIINDGSPDRSREIVLEYAGKHPNIVFIDQENQGVSVARNRGLDVAKGDYIAFIDPDDTLHPLSIPEILERAITSDLDILYLSLESFDEFGKFLETKPACGLDDVVERGFVHPRRTFLSTLYKRTVIGDVRFIRGITRGQDTVFNVMVQASAEKCSYCSVPYYKYLKRSDSSRQFVGTEKTFQSCLLAIESIDAFRNRKFPEASVIENRYFDDAILIFVRRTLEWNILPQSNEKNFNRLKSRLNELGLQRLMFRTAEAFPMFDKSFSVFMAFRKIRGFWDALKYKLNLE